MSSSSVTKAHIVSRSVAAKNVLSADELELFELANLAGVTMHPKVFKIIVDLLHMNVAPVAIERMLRSMSSSRRASVPVTSSLSQTSMSTTHSVSSISSFASPVFHTDSSRT